MLTNANKGTYLVKKWQKYANVIYERSLSLINDFVVEAYSNMQNKRHGTPIMKQNADFQEGISEP